MDLFGNRRKRTTDKPSTAYVDEVITYLYNADDRITSELLDKQNNGTTDQTTTYAWSGTRQSSKTVVIPSTSTVTQTFSYTLPGMLSRVVTENKNGSNVVTSRTRVDYDYTSTGIRSLSVDWNDANLNNSFATSERTGSVEYLVDSTNHTGYAQTIVETTKNAAGVATKRIVYTYGSDEISQTTYLPPAGGGAGWNAGTTLTFSHDAHTSVRMLTDAAGAMAQVFTYAAYGELIAIHNRIAQSVGTVGAQGLQSQALTSLLYNGESFDSRIGQLYLRARWYDGHRFTTLDPFFGNGSDPLSFNKYGFVHANPIMSIDPTGLAEFSLGGFFSANSISTYMRAIKIQAARSVLHGGLRDAGKRIAWQMARNFVEWYYIDNHINATIDALAGFAYEVSGWRDPTIATIVSRLNMILGTLTAMRRVLSSGPLALMPLLTANPDYKGSRFEGLMNHYLNWKSKTRTEGRIAAGLIALGSMPLLIKTLNGANTTSDPKNTQLSFQHFYSPVAMVGRLLLGSAFGTTGPNAFISTVWLPDLINAAREKFRNSPNPQSFANAIDFLVHEMALRFPAELETFSADDEDEE